MTSVEFDAGRIAAPSGPSDLLSAGHPDDVVESSVLTTAEKRAILADWASDERTVVGEPTLRQLPSGAIVRLYDIQRALLALDRGRGAAAPRFADRYSPARRHGIAGWINRRRRRPWDDDPDPPHAPAAALRPVAV